MHVYIQLKFSYIIEKFLLCPPVLTKKFEKKPSCLITKSITDVANVLDGFVQYFQFLNKRIIFVRRSRNHHCLFSFHCLYFEPCDDSL